MSKHIVVVLTAVLLMLPSVLALHITHVPSTDVDAAQTTAVIRWTTDEPSNSTIVYGLDGVRDQSVARNVQVSDHHLTLQHLTPGKQYSYMLYSGDVTSGPHVFQTPHIEATFLTLNPLEEVISQEEVTVSGTTAPKARVLIYVNRGISTTPKKDRPADESGMFSFELKLDSTRTQDGIPGWNQIEVVSIDDAGRRDNESVVVIVDMTPPKLIVGDIPDMFTKETASRFTLTGLTDPDAQLQLFIDEANPIQLGISENGTFSQLVSLAGRVNASIRLVASDAVGNTQTLEKSVIIDDKPPEIDISSDIAGTVHFKVLMIEGKTDPNTKVTATNMGEWATVDQFRRSWGNGTRLTLLIDPTGLILGKGYTVTSDSDGNFRVPVNLMKGLSNKPGRNHILIEAEDRAGNVNERIYPITYQPDCSVWTIGNQRSYPVSIWANYWNSGQIVGGAYFELKYQGLYEPENLNIQVGVERISSPGLLQNTINRLEGNIGVDAAQYPVQPGNPKISFDKEKEMAHVYIPLTVPRNAQPPSKMPDQLDVRLKLKLTYSVNDPNMKTATSSFDPLNPSNLPSNRNEPCELYPIITYNVQKPEVLTSVFKKWLTPESINKTIDFVDDMISATESAQSIASKVSTATAALCGVLYGYNMFFGQSECPTSTYWVCDRVMCPPVPPDSKPESDFEGNFREESRTSIFERTLETPTNENKGTWVKQEIELINISNSNKGLEDMDITDRKNMRYYAQKNANCDTFIIERTRESTDMSYQTDKLRTPDVSVSTRYACANESYDSLRRNPDVLARYTPTQYYDETCPQYDRSKCIAPKKGLDPASNIINSVMCGCFTGVNGHLKGLLKIEQGLKQCFQQAYVGEIYGGMCERLLAQYTCYFIEGALQWAMPQISNLAYNYNTDGEREQNKEQLERLRTRMSDRYEGIIGGRFGLSTDRVSSSFCTAAFTGDWSTLETALEAFVEDMPVAPMMYFRPTSRPFAFDPITGKMSIGYNIYAGIVPGGDTYIKAYMRCNPAREGGEFCGKNPMPMDRNNLNIPSFMTKEDPLFDENLLFIDPDARYWYNELVVDVEYELSGQRKHQKIVKDIKRSGNLAPECYFKPTQGISCVNIFGNETGGIVYLYPAGVSLSPSVKTFFPENQMNVKVRMDNQANEDFYLAYRMDGPDPDKINYPSDKYLVKASNEEDQMYVMPIPAFPEFTMPASSLKSTYLDIEDIQQEVEWNDIKTENGVVKADIHWKTAGSQGKSRVFLTRFGALSISAPGDTVATLGYDTSKDMTEQQKKDWMFNPVSDYPIPDDAKTILKKVETYNSKIQKASIEFGVDADLIYGLIARESAGNPKAVSKTGCIGLGQFCILTAKDYAKGTSAIFDETKLIECTCPKDGTDCTIDDCNANDDRFDPDKNIRATAKHLHSLLTKYKGVEELAVAAYNVGSGVIDNAIVSGSDHWSVIQDRITPALLLKSSPYKTWSEADRKKKVNEVKNHVTKVMGFTAEKRGQSGTTTSGDVSDTSFLLTALMNLDYQPPPVDMQSVEPNEKTVSLRIQNKEYDLIYLGTDSKEIWKSGKYKITVWPETLDGQSNIPHEGREQIFPFDFSYDNHIKNNLPVTSCARNPIIDLVEPPTQIINQDFDVPISFTFHDDCNRLAFIHVIVEELRGGYNKELVVANTEYDGEIPLSLRELPTQKVSFSTDTGGSPACPNANHDITLYSLPSDTSPSLFRLMWRPPKDKSFGGEESGYKILVKAWDYPLGNETPKAAPVVERVVRIDTTGTYKEEYHYAFTDLYDNTLIRPAFPLCT